MGSKIRLFTAVLAGLLIAIGVLRLQRGSLSISDALVSTNDVERNLALKKLQSGSGSKKDGVITELAGTHAVSTDPRTRMFALYALRKSGDASASVSSTLISGLADEDEGVRREAEVGLREFGTPVLPALIKRMLEPGVRGTAAQIIRVAQPDALAVIENALRGPDDADRLAAAYLLSRGERPEFRTDAKRLLPELGALLRSDNSALAVSAAFAIHNIDPADTRAEEVFLAQVKGDDWDSWDVRGWDALDALVAMPGSWKKAAPVLSSLVPTAPDGLQKNRRFKRAALGAALEKMSPRNREPSSLSTDLRSRHAVLRWRAAYVLSTAEKVDPAMMGPLVSSLGDKDEFTAARAFAALNVMGLGNTERVAATVHPKLRSAFKRLDGKVPGFTEMAGPALETLGK